MERNVRRMAAIPDGKRRKPKPCDPRCVQQCDKLLRRILGIKFWKSKEGPAAQSAGCGTASKDHETETSGDYTPEVLGES